MVSQARELPLLIAAGWHPNGSDDVRLWREFPGAKWYVFGFVHNVFTLEYGVVGLYDDDRLTEDGVPLEDKADAEAVRRWVASGAAADAERDGVQIGQPHQLGLGTPEPARAPRKRTPTLPPLRALAAHAVSLGAKPLGARASCAGHPHLSDAQRIQRGLERGALERANTYARWRGEAE